MDAGNKISSFVSAVIYMHNDEENAVGFLKMIYDTLSQHFINYELICVDDCSKDRTAKRVGEAAADCTAAVTVVSMSYFQGLECGMNAGRDIAIGDFVFEFDRAVADFSPDLIIEAYKRSCEGFDIVSARPNGKKAALSEIFYNVFNRFSHTAVPLGTESFRVLSRRAINRIDALNQTIPYRKAVYANSGLQTDSIRYAPILRQGFIDGHEFRNKRDTAAVSLILFTNIAFRMAVVLALIMMLLTITTAAYVIFIVLSSNRAVEGWTTTMLFSSGSFFGVFALLGVIIKYISVLIDLVFRRAKYVVGKITKLN